MRKWESMTDIQKENLRQKRSLQIVSDETKKKTSEKMRWIRKTDEHRKAIAAGKRWFLNPQWKWWVTSETHNARTSVELKLWRKAVMERDDYTCQKCNQRWWYLHAHHLNNFAEHIDLRFAIDNWVTLCKECHIKYHQMFGRKNNTDKQYLLFGKDI